MTYFKDKHVQWFPQNHYSMNIITISKRTKENLILGVFISYEKLDFTAVNNSFKQQKFYSLIPAKCLLYANNESAVGSSILDHPLCDWNWWNLTVQKVLGHGGKRNSGLFRHCRMLSHGKFLWSLSLLKFHGPKKLVWPCHSICVMCNPSMCLRVEKNQTLVDSECGGQT